MSSPAESIDTEALTALLRHFNWAPTSKVPGRYEIWTTRDREDDEVIVPLDPQKGDFAGLLDRARYVMLSQYGRAAYELLDMLRAQASAALDATQWHKDSALPAGMISWQQGEELYASARAQLSAIARSSRQPRRHHGSANWFISRSFLESCYMGQTEIGSFVITAHTHSRTRFHVSRHSQEVSFSSPRESQTISGRVIIDNFERALKAVSGALEDFKRQPKIEVFYDTIEEGVSYELVKALSKFTQGSESAIRIDRSADGAGNSVPVEVAFAPTSAPILDQVANALVLDPEPQGVTLQGEVIVLSRETDREGPARIIRLNVEGASDINKVRVRLDADQYEVAMEAHRREASLQVRGRLEKENNRWWLYNATDLAIVERFRSKIGTEQPETLPLFFDDKE
jgi:hypothetical protein